MGLKSKLNKIKNFLYDEEEVNEPKKIIKKHKEEKVEQVIDDSNEIEELNFDDDFDDIEIKSRATKEIEVEKDDFSFPNFDDDDDFVVPQKEEIIEKPVIEERPIYQTVKKEQPSIPLYQGTKRREESNKKFKPSPIISPVYGLLDEAGNVSKKEEVKEYYKKDEVSIDEVRNKAYGIKDDSLSELKSKTIEEAENDYEEELSREKANKVIETSEKEEIKNDDDDDDMILPNINFKEFDVDEERKKSKEKKEIVEEVKKEVTVNDDDDEDDTKEQDLFNLLDDIYTSKKGNEE